jgi:cell division protein DivIC
MKFPEYQKVSDFVQNKYFFASIIFAAWILFFDKNNVADHIRNYRKVKNLETQKEFYKGKIAVDKQKLEYLNSGVENLEKFAREQYYMKKSGEDIFVVVEK